MDYSLVVGVDAEKQELVVGVVDYIRTFTWSVTVASDHRLMLTFALQGQEAGVVDQGRGRRWPRRTDYRHAKAM